MEEAAAAIGEMAYARRATLSDVLTTNEYQEQIRRLAELCAMLAPGLARDPQYPPTQALRAAWKRLNDDQRLWLHTCLKYRGFDLRTVIGQPEPS
ncbi:hypothetical protein OHA18_06640 [Kribbella sp. NBC_00709]|uniref:hypothetical protein n=1 Tax=Kribbella sp. NBC_00709 TaxID=2975972 RepID=UPI002E2AE406|nr:hypothetical protein [Kribbella sp. NBC_00709]